MALIKRHRLSSRALTARRLNALKSTGPRAKRRGRPPAELPKFDHGRYVRSLYHTMVALGEEPEEFIDFLRRLIQSHLPATPTEMMLVEDIAVLEWERRRVDRAQAAVQVRQVEQLELERSKRLHEMGSPDYGGPAAEIKRIGLRGAPDSPAKFEELLGYIEAILELVKKRDFSTNCGSIFRVIYGENPTWRGVKMIRLFDDFAERQAAAPAEETELDKASFDTLLLAALEEQRDVIEEYRNFMAEHIEITPAMRNAVIAPRGPEWGLMLRQKNSIDRQIERKIKLLLQLQRERAARQAERASQPAGKVPDPAAGAPSKAGG